MYKISVLLTIKARDLNNWLSAEEKAKMPNYAKINR